MATTKNGTYYPDDYNKEADVPADMKKLAESIDVQIDVIKGKNDSQHVDIQNNKNDIKTIQGNISAIEQEQTIQNNKIQVLETDNKTNETNISKNASDIAEMQKDIADINEKDTDQDKEIETIKQKDINQDEAIQVNAENIKQIVQDVIDNAQDINENAKKINENAKSLEQLQSENTELKAECKRLNNDKKAIAISVNEKGGHLSLKGTSDSRFNDFEICGNLKQETSVKGKNIVPTNKKFWENGHYATLGTKTDNASRIRLIDLIEVKPNTEYYNLNNVVLRAYDKDKNFVRDISVVYANRTFTTAEDEYYLGVSIDCTLDNYVEETNQIMICLKSVSDKIWEAGTVDMPSFDYSSEIKAIGQNINYFDGELEAGNLSSSTGATLVSTNCIRTKNFQEVEGEETYTLSSSKNYHAVIYQYNKNKEFISLHNTTGVTPITFKLDKNCKYIKWRTGTVDNEDDVNCEFKLEKGTAPTGHSPFNQGSINTVVSNKNIFNINDKKTGSFSSQYAVDNEDWVSIKDIDNSEGTSTKYFNAFTNKSKCLKPDTEYYLVLEVKEVAGTGVITAFSYSNEGSIGQFDRTVAYDFADLNAGDVKIKAFKTLKDFTKCSTMLRTYTALRAGETGSITFRISVLETEPTAENFVYAKHEEQTKTIPTQKEMLENDKFVKKNGKWYERHSYVRAILDGSSLQIWNSQAVINDIQFALTAYQNVINKTGKCYSNIASQTSKYGDTNGIVISTTGVIYFRVPKEFLNGAEINNTNVNNLLKQKMEEGNAVEIIVELAEPELVECTEEQSLILDEIEKTIRTYKDMTYIFSNNEISPIYNVSYNVDTKTYIDNQINKLATTTVALIGGEVNA